MSTPANFDLSLRKRISEPQNMGKIEHEVFEKESRENYKRWMVPLVDDALERFKENNTNDSLKILDIACGPGLLTKELAERSSKFCIFGLDNSSHAIKLAKKNCKNLLKQKRVIFKLGSVYSVPFADNFFDLVVCKDSIHHFDNLKLALKEMFRVAKPRGMVYIQDIRRDLPCYLLKMAIPPDTIFKKLQYYSARASYTKKELLGGLKVLGVKKSFIQTRKITDRLKNRYKKIGINMLQLKAAFQSRFVAVFYK